MKVKISVAFQCGECSKVSLDKRTAELCCEKHFCRVCGIEVRKFHFLCDDCTDRQRLEKAKIIEGYKGWVYDWKNEKYFDSVESLIEEYEDEELEIPEFVFACIEEKPYIHVDHVLEDILSEVDPEVRDSIIFDDEKELYDFIDAWNEKQNSRWYYTDLSKKVRVK